MRRYLEIATNVAILATSFVVVYAFLAPRPAAMRTAQPPVGQPPQAALQKGDRLAVARDLDVDRADQTLLLVLRSACRYCTESMPFYSRLSRRLQDEQSRTRLQLVVVTRDEPETAGLYLREHGLVVQRTVQLTPDLAKALKVPGTPSLVLVDRTGLVRNVWFGKLDSEREKRVEDALFTSPS
jgi:thioredoxin-related protein